MKLLSVNLAKPRKPTWKIGRGDPDRTGIDKHPVEGPVRVFDPERDGLSGVEGDKIFDVDHHGGHDQAVYAYAREDYVWWESQLGRSLRSGEFGENLTLSGLDPNESLIGERWRIGAEVELEVCSVRTPCGTFQGWMGEGGWVKRFSEAERPGPYLRVRRGGVVAAGDAVTVRSRPDHGVTVRMVYQALNRGRTELLPRLLETTQLPEEVLAKVRRRLGVR